MASSPAISPRPLTNAERGRIDRAHRRIAEAEDAARELVRSAIADRDAEIAKAVKNGASQTDIAEALGVTRQAIYNAVRRSAST